MEQEFKIKRIDWLLIAGAVMTPMTGLRIGKIGPAEVLLFLWAIYRIQLARIYNTPLVSFFVVFLSSMLVGTFICLAAVPNEFSRTGWVTWIYLSFIACTLYKRLSENDLDYNIKVFDLICRLSVIWYLMLYFYSTYVSKSFFGAPLWYYHRYSGGGTNPHQIAVLLCGVAFWFVRNILIREKTVKNIVYFVLAVFLENLTASSTGTASIILGVFVSLMAYTVVHVQSIRSRILIISFEIIAGVLIVTMFSSYIYQMAYEWVSDDANGIGRFQIWSSFGQMFKKSPIFGLGPGQHALTGAGNIKEFHNSYLEIFAATGMIGFGAFLVLTYRIIQQIWRGDLSLLPVITGIYAYSMAGFAFRRLAYWVVFTFVFVLATQIENRRQKSYLRNR